MTPTTDLPRWTEFAANLHQGDRLYDGRTASVALIPETFRSRNTALRLDGSASAAIFTEAYGAEDVTVYVQHGAVSVRTANDFHLNLSDTDTNR